MPPDAADTADAELLYGLLLAVAARPQDQVGAGRSRTLLRRAIELIWEKPRESGGSYGQYRFSFLWSPSAIERANANLGNASYSGDRGLVKEHVVPYGLLIARLIRDAGQLTAETLAEILRTSITVAVITAAEDKAIRDRSTGTSFVPPEDLDLTDAERVWDRYPPAVVKSLRRVRVAARQQVNGARLLEAIEGEAS